MQEPHTAPPQLVQPGPLVPLPGVDHLAFGRRLALSFAVPKIADFHQGRGSRGTTYDQAAADNQRVTASTSCHSADWQQHVCKPRMRAMVSEAKPLHTLLNVWHMRMGSDIVAHQFHDCHPRLLP